MSLDKSKYWYKSGMSPVNSDPPYAKGNHSLAEFIGIAPPVWIADSELQSVLTFLETNTYLLLTLPQQLAYNLAHLL